MRKVIGVGETILDIIFENSKPSAAVPGGSVFNAMISLGRLMIPVEFISEIGNDKVGAIIKSFMEENNLTTKYIDIFPDGKSAISLAFLNKNNDAEYLFYKDYPKQRLDVPFPIINDSDIVMFGSFYAINPTLRERIVELMDYATQRRAIIYYDPNFRISHAHESIRLAPSILENLEYASIIRGSDEDFYNLFKMDDVDKIYDQKIKFYCPNFICTLGAKGVELRTNSIRKHYEVPAIQPVSTIGAGDNFNAGLTYGLLKLNISRNEVDGLSESAWDKIIGYAIDFSSSVCQNYENYISKEFAEKII